MGKPMNWRQGQQKTGGKANRTGYLGTQSFGSAGRARSLTNDPDARAAALASLDANPVDQPTSNIRPHQPPPLPLTRKPSPREIEDARTPRGGWSRKTLAHWGVAWPPKKGWRQRLEDAWRRKHPAGPQTIRHPTIPPDDDLTRQFAATIGTSKPAAEIDPTTRNMVVTSGANPDGSLRVFTGDEARREFYAPFPHEQQEQPRR